MIHVLHITDSLELGGAERMAVNLANEMPRDRYRAYLCATRHEGPLADCIAGHVERICLYRRHRWALRPALRLVRFIRSHRVQILHAHGTSLLLADFAALFPPHPRLVWHVHFGGYPTTRRFDRTYRLLARRVHGVVAASEPLVRWSRDRLGVSGDRIGYLPNFVCDAQPVPAYPGLPGKAGKRIVCVANFRPEKDHGVLLEAVSQVRRLEPDVHLFLVGASVDEHYAGMIRNRIAELQLHDCVTWMGTRGDVPALLQSMDVGVLSSRTEGLPLSLLEYGAAGLASVATRVGQCPDVLDQGPCGLLVPPCSPSLLAEAIASLLANEAQRAALGASLKEHVRKHFSAAAAVEQLDGFYRQMLASQPVGSYAG